MFIKTVFDSKKTLIFTPNKGRDINTIEHIIWHNLLWKQHISGVKILPIWNILFHEKISNRTDITIFFGNIESNQTEISKPES